jgi:protein TonB
MLATHHPRLLRALGLSLVVHTLMLTGLQHRAGSMTPALLAAFEPLEVTLIGGPRQTARTLVPVPAATLPASTEKAPPGTQANADTAPLVEARSDVASLNNPKPPYPLAARRRGLEGRVLLAARVSTDGVCAEVRLRQSSGHALLDEAALTTVRRWRFVPARRGETPVESWVNVPISFRLNS